MRIFLRSFLILFFAIVSRAEAQKTVGIFTFTYGVNTWDPESVHSGIPGSEEAVIYVSKYLANLGYQVTVFGNPPKDSLHSLPTANPRFVPWEMHLEAPLDVGIVWRIIQAGPELKKFAKTLYLWPHDVLDLRQEITQEQIDAFQDVLWISDWQRKDWMSKNSQFAKFTNVFGNGIEPSQFSTISPRENPYSCIYASNYARGLEHLLDMWPQIKNNFSKATLDIYYGWNHWGNLSSEKEALMRKKIKDLEELEVYEHGMVGHQELAKAFEKASFWTYPCTADETFCITALKAQLAGAVPVICKNTALVETCPSGFSCSTPQEYFSLLVKAMQQVEQISLEERTQFGQFVLGKFTWEKIAQHWKDHFDRTNKKICLHMVVKNHKDSIAKSLEAVKDKIDSWILVDTGSTDGTLDIAKNILSQVPGQILISRSQTPHKDTLYWAQSEANYVLLVDPQEELFFSEHFVMPSTDHDYYLDYTKQKVLFVKNSFPWDSIEGLKDQEHKAENILSGVVGSWSFFPFLPFAFAQSYIETKEYGVAKRILESSIHKKLETSFLYPALYQKAILSELLGEDLDHVLKNYGDAFVASSNKAEPLFRMSVYACNKGHYPLAYSLIKTAASMPRPQDRADNEDWIYDYGIAFAWGNCALGMKKYEEAKLAYEQALDYSGLSESVRQEILENLKFAASDFLN